MVDLNTHKKSILDLDPTECEKLILELRHARRESIVYTAITKRAAPAKKAIAKKAAGTVKKLSLDQAKALLQQLQSEMIQSD